MQTPLLDVRNLVKHYTRRSGLLARRQTIAAVDDVSFTMGEGEAFGLVGESGSGKSTLARCLLRLDEPTSGEVFFRGQDVLTMTRRPLREFRRQAQIVFQDPYASLNPRMRVRQILEEPFIVHRIGTRLERQDRVDELLSMVGLDPADRNRYPRELSGGQQQRVGLARALALNPALLVADEPVSALDASVQAQIVNLLLDLRQKLKLSYLLIAHDLRLIEHVCTRIAVLYRGRIVEVGRAPAIFSNPRHAYTKALLSSAPPLDPGIAPERIVLQPEMVKPGAPLRHLGDGHYAAV